MAKNVAEKLVDTLEEAGVKRIYAVTGDSLNKVNDAVRENGKIKWIHVRHEETGAFAAGAEAQLTGTLACCAGSSGPGHVHLINGLYDAHRSGAPVLAIASTIPTDQFGTGYFQETDTIRLFGDCSYYNQVVTTPYELPRMLQAAMQTAISEKGVAVIGLPGDVTFKNEEEVDSSQRFFPTYQRIVPSVTEIEELAALLNGTEKVTLFCGIGAKDAHTELVQLSQLLHAPVAYSFKSKMEIQYDNPNEVGLTGLLGMPSGYDSMHEADVLLMLGTDFPYNAFLPEHNKIVQIDIKASRLGRRAKLKMGLCGDVRDTLRLLLPLIRQKTDDSFLRTQLAQYRKVRELFESTAKEKGKENNIQPEYVTSVLNELASDDAIFTVDTGMSCVWGARYLQATGKRKMLGSFNHGSMANAMPQAIGAALAYPDRQVIAMCGDGGLSMLLGDLATISEYKLPVKLIVYNNRNLGMVKLEMEVSGIPDNETFMYNPDFSRVAMAAGIPGYNVSNPEDVFPVLTKALLMEGPVLVNIMTDPNALALPPHIEFSQMLGFAQAMYRMMLTGRSKDILDTIHTNIKHLKEVL